MDGTNVTRIQFSAESLTLTIELSETNKDNYGLQNGVLEEWDNFEQYAGAEWCGNSGVKFLCMLQLL